MNAACKAYENQLCLPDQMPDDPYWIVTVAARIMCCQFLHTIELVSNSCVPYNKITITNVLIFFYFASAFRHSLFLVYILCCSLSFQSICRFCFRLSYEARERRCVFYSIIIYGIGEKQPASQPASHSALLLLFRMYEMVHSNRVNSNIWTISQMHISFFEISLEQLCYIVVELYIDFQFLRLQFLIGFSIPLIIFTSQKLFFEIASANNHFELKNRSAWKSKINSKKSPCA